MALAGAAWSAAFDSDDVSAIMGTPPKNPKVLRLKRLGPDGSIYIRRTDCGLNEEGPHVRAALLFLTVYLYCRRLGKTQMALSKVYFWGVSCFDDWRCWFWVGRKELDKVFGC